MRKLSQDIITIQVNKIFCPDAIVANGIQWFKMYTHEVLSIIHYSDHGVAVDIAGTTVQWWNEVRKETQLSSEAIKEKCLISCDK